MGELRLRNIDDETVERISVLARRHGRTVEHETLTLIREALGIASDGVPADRVALVKRIAAMAPKGIPQTDSVILIREDRDR